MRSAWFYASCVVALFTLSSLPSSYNTARAQDEDDQKEEKQDKTEKKNGKKKEEKKEEKKDADVVQYFTCKVEASLLEGGEKVLFCFGNDDDVYLPDSTYKGKGAINNGRGGKNFNLVPVERIEGDVWVTVGGVFYLKEAYAKAWFNKKKGSNLDGLFMKGELTDWNPVELELTSVDTNTGLALAGSGK